MLGAPTCSHLRSNPRAVPWTSQIFGPGPHPSPSCLSILTPRLLQGTSVAVPTPLCSYRQVPAHSELPNRCQQGVGKGHALGSQQPGHLWTSSTLEGLRQISGAQRAPLSSGHHQPDGSSSLHTPCPLAWRKQASPLDMVSQWRCHVAGGGAGRAGVTDSMSDADMCAREEDRCSCPAGLHASPRAQWVQLLGCGAERVRPQLGALLKVRALQCHSSPGGTSWAFPTSHFAK